MEYLQTFLGSNNNQLTNINDLQLLDIAKVINSISIETNNIDISLPSIVVVGSQSSGKSSLLNSILKMDILPTGKTMTTRTPLHIQLCYNEKMYAQFDSKTIQLTNPLPTLKEVEEINNEIKRQTILKAGNEMNVSEDEIYLKICSPYVPNLNLIDLPGLTMVACTDKGQPSDIKEKIRSLVSKYIKNEKNIILCVIPAREDIETDIALELVKSYDTNLKNTMGVLTKIDLMNKNNDVVKYLKNNISKDLIVNYGYYAIKNRSNEDMKTKNINMGIEDEKKFFNTQDEYKDIVEKDKCGIINMSNKLNGILLQKIKIYLPSLKNELNSLNKKYKEDLTNLGEEVPIDTQGKHSLYNNIINNICQNYELNINQSNTKFNSGRYLKQIFIEYRNNIDSICENISCLDSISDEDLKSIIINSEGNHMSFPIFKIEALEACIKDKKIKIFENLHSKSVKCVYSIDEKLIELLDNLLKNDYINRFNLFSKKIREHLINKVFIQNRETTIKEISVQIFCEENYIWTDHEEFKNQLSQYKNKNNDISMLRKTILCYFRCIIEIFKHNIPKLIMYHYVKKSILNLKTLLYNLNNKEFIDLLKENDNQNKKRTQLKEYMDKINYSLNVLNNYE